MSCTIIESSLVVKNKVILSEKSINKTLCQPANAIVQDQDGNELARKDIPSGGSEIIEVQAGGVQETAIIIDFDQSNSLLEYTIIAGVDQAGDYISESLTNVATVEYSKNGVVTALPFTLADGDNLTVTITRTDSALDSTVKISNV